MKKLTILYFSLLAIIFSSCDPIEKTNPIGGEISANELNIKATPIVVNGKNSNKVILENHSPVLSNWDYGVGTSQRQTDTVLLVVEGTNKITFTGLNPNGTTISKELSVSVDELSFPVPLEWGYLCGTGEKEWVWDTTQPAVWGNGGYMVNNAPAWWTLNIDAIDGQAAGDGVGASMIFSLQGASLTKNKSDGTKEKGTFSFDITQKIVLGDGTVWATGKLKTKAVNVLCGISPNEGRVKVYEYDILIINNNQLVLSYPEADVEVGGTAWFWMFKAK
ncbi:hypothetical protein [uncultured Dysgonomonas sp.]|uniref:PKD domain-containing protein n=1 Tax=uncultured Dysgonomonas sp. TaxID=206096 RepID=A0A212K5I9_9BACT|nr:hypothetical protein [uncultured Dysgonomonas sp.]SBW06984.1 conserved hypothetical protein [uncultured Dysgonomonas sp.]